MPKLRILAAAIAVAGLSAGIAQADTLTDQTLPTPPGFFNGTGQPNDHFVTNNDGDALIALGVINRYVGSVAPTSPSSSTYNVQAGFYQGAAGNCQGSCSHWNIQFSLALVGRTLSEIATQSLTISDTFGHTITVDPLHSFYDDAGFNPSNGTTNTAYSPGIDLRPIGPYLPPIDNTGVDSIYQNSQNITFYPLALAGFDPLAGTTYSVVFSYRMDESDTTYSVAETINAIAATPLPAALPLFASGLGALGLFAHRRKRKAGKAGKAAA